MIRHVAALAAIAMIGCFATASGMREKRTDPGAGLAKEYKGDCRAHYAVAKRAVERLNLDVTEENEQAGEIYVRRGSRASDGVSGDRLAIWFDPVANGCRVRIYARGQNAWAVGGEDWPQFFFRTMKRVRDEAD